MGFLIKLVDIFFGSSCLLCDLKFFVIIIDVFLFFLFFEVWLELKLFLEFFVKVIYLFVEFCVLIGYRF